MSVRPEMLLKSSDGELAKEILLEMKIRQHQRRLKVLQEENKKLEEEIKAKPKDKDGSYVHNYVRLYNLRKRRKKTFFGLRKRSSAENLNKPKTEEEASAKVSKEVRFNSQDLIGYEDTPALIWLRPQTPPMRSSGRFKSIKAMFSRIF